MSRKVETKDGIPRGAKRVFRGVLWEVYHWKQKAFDGTQHTFEGIKGRGSAKILAIANGKIMITKEERVYRKGYYYTLPGGIIDWDERPIDAAKREFLEETGMASKRWTEIYAVDMGSWRAQWNMHFFIVEDYKKVAEPKLDPGERLEVLHMSPKQFLRIAKNRKLSASSLFEFAKHPELMAIIKKKLNT